VLVFPLPHPASQYPDRHWALPPLEQSLFSPNPNRAEQVLEEQTFEAQ
jgi:hypothetical protein